MKKLTKKQFNKLFPKSSLKFKDIKNGKYSNLKSLDLTNFVFNVPIKMNCTSIISLDLTNLKAIK